jgi:hypothetical protein
MILPVKSNRTKEKKAMGTGVLNSILGVLVRC